MEIGQIFKSAKGSEAVITGFTKTGRVKFTANGREWCWSVKEFEKLYKREG